MTLQCCIDNCKASEASNTQIKSLGQSIKEEVQRVKERSKHVKKKTDVGAKESKQKGWKLPKRRRQHVILASSVEEITTLAGNIVLLKKANCRSGGKDNYFTKCCHSTNRNTTHGVREEYEESSSDADDISEERSSESDYIDCVTLTPNSISTVEHRENVQEIHAEMILKGKAIRFQVDCGGECQCANCKVCRT